MHAHPDIHRELARQRRAELVRQSSRPRSHQNQVDTGVGALVGAAKAGDREAWGLLVEQFTPMLRTVVRGYRLSAADAADAVQETWVAAYTHIDRLREPEAFGGWLAVTARRNALRVLERRRLEIVTDDDEQLGSTATEASPESAVLEAEERRALQGAVGRLTGRQARIIQALLRHPGVGYAELAEGLGVPVGSIGPTRERALARLRRDRRLSAAL